MKLKEENSPSIHVEESPNVDMPEQCANEDSNTTCEEQPCSYIPDIYTEDLTEEQRLIVRKMLAEEAESFSKTDDDVRRAGNCKWTLTSLIQYQFSGSILPFPDHFMQKSSSMLRIC